MGGGGDDRNHVRDRKPVHDDLDELLENTLEDLKLSENNATVGNNENVDKPDSTKKGDEDFQKMINEFCNSNPDDLPAKIDSSLGKLLSMTDDGMTNDADFAEVDQMIEQLMSEMTSKELLAEPFAELAKAYPIWIEEHGEQLETSTLKNYLKQSSIICEIDQIFKSAEFDENKESHQKKIFSLMQQMQELGSPPESLLSELGMVNEKQQEPPECIQM